MKKVYNDYFQFIIIFAFFYVLMSIDILNSLQSKEENYQFKGNGFKEESNITYKDMDKYFITHDKIFVAEGIEFSMAHREPRNYFFPGKVFEDPYDMNIYIRIDSRANEKNKNGFQLGDWIPGSKVTYTIQKQDFNSNSKKEEGELFVIIDRYGPHYGKNLKLFGEGQYIIYVNFYPAQILNIYEDINNKKIKEEASVSPIFKYPIQLVYEFTYKK